MAYSNQYCNKKIIIIGAGISGLACSRHLRNFGFKNIKILEGRDRVGGRTYTITDYMPSLDLKEKAHFIEIGAQWIHGQCGNAIYELAHSEGLLNENVTNYIDVLLDLKHCFTTLDELELINNMLNYLDKALENKFVSLMKNTNVSEYLHEEFQKYVVNKDISVTNLLRPVFRWYCLLQCELNGCIDLSSVCFNLINQYKYCEGSQTIELKYGYNSIINLLLKEIPYETILFTKEVVNINYTYFKNQQFSNQSKKPITNICSCMKDENEGKIKVTCSDGEVYEADHVIVTVPLGYLKRHMNTLFLPPLPSEKSKSIQAIGFGTVNKIYLEFSEPFWEPTRIYQVIWDDYLLNIFSEELQYDKEAILWMTDINRFAYSPGHRNMLCAWIVGEGAIIMEKLSDEVVSLCCYTLLEKIVKRKIPKYKRMIRSSWHSDPYTFGSYSYLSMEGCSINSNMCLAEPVLSDIYFTQHPVLQFAGEATHSTYYSTAHGAYESGIREAERLFDHYRLGRDFSKICLYENIKIVVIGAGIAGLSAADALFKMGFSQISILEAQEKVGGRIYSFLLDDYILELGAQWLHGTDNDLHKFSVDHNLLCSLTDEPSYEGKGLFCTCNGYVINKSVVEEMKFMLENAKNKLERGLYDTAFSSKSAESYFLDYYNKNIANSVDDSLNIIRKGLFDWFLRFEIIDNACDNLSQVAVQCYSEWCNIPDDEYHLNYKDGFISLLKTIQSQFPKECLHLKKPVKSINWQKKDNYSKHINDFFVNRSPDLFPVSLECDDGEKIDADVVIVTASVGFLKENIETFFKPFLPKMKARTICNTGFGTINKIFLIFHKPFWNLHDDGFQFVWTNNMDEKCKMLLTEHHWIKGITGFDIVRKQQNVLLGWIGGVEAKIIEDVDTKTISSVCTNLLRIFLNRGDIPNPIKTIRSIWYKNSYTRGAYSYRTPEFQKSTSTFKDLQSPLYSSYMTNSGETLQWPVVVFAGEAMNETSFSSVHGAYESGLKAANDIEYVCSQLLVSL